jgi:hypothetical protein
MIDMEIGKLEKNRNWTPLEREQLREEIDAELSKPYDTSRKILFVIIDMIREKLRDIDDKYLGKK